MNENNVLLHEDLILLDYQVESREDLLKDLSAILEEKGYVKESYIDGLLEREEKFPTGLNTGKIQVAIPHTKAEHVKKPAILIAKLKKTVLFKEMGNEQNDVEVKLVFLMAITNPKSQVNTLTKLMTIFSNKDLLNNIYNSTSSKKIMTILSEVLN